MRLQRTTRCAARWHSGGRCSCHVRARRRTRKRAAGRRAAGPKPTLEIYGFAHGSTCDRRLQAEQSGLVRRQPRRRKLPAFDERVRRRTATFYRACGRAASACRATTADRARRREDDVRVRAVRHRRRRRPDHVPPAPRLRRVGQFGAGQTGSPFMDSDVFPNSLEYWGPNGHGVLPQRAGALDADHDGDTNADARARDGRAPAATPASTRTASSCRTSGRASRCPTSPAHYRLGRNVGLRASSAASLRLRSNGTTCSTTRSTCAGSATGLGHQPQLERQVRRRTTCSACSSCTARASRTT